MLRAADSWLVVDGRARGWDEHWARFGAAAGRDTRAFAAWCARQLDRPGRWFPRVEADERGQLTLERRPAPDPLTTAVVWARPVADDRAQPRTKGPDLGRLGEHRAAAHAHGADEALLAASDGTLLEGAYTSLLWWEGETLCAVPDDAPILPGVTRALLLGLARADGVAVRFARPRVEELFDREVWLTSALHGIRAVTAWAGTDAGADAPTPAPPATRAAAWRERLDALMRPVAPPSRRPAPPR